MTIIIFKTWPFARQAAIMSIKPSRKELTHERILESAARALRRDGYQGVGVADVMKDAGLTHGGFYAHFASRDAMLAEAVERAGHESGNAVRQDMARRIDKGASPFRAMVEAYLSDLHLKSLEQGCPVAALASEMARQPDEVREASCERVRQFIRAIDQVLPPDAPPESAMVIVSTLVGSLQLARALGANKKGKALLAATCKALIAQYDAKCEAPCASAAGSAPSH
jgi:TetR/AcrR family transcriptional repressor of nem operon